MPVTMEATEALAIICANVGVTKRQPLDRFCSHWRRWQRPNGGEDGELLVGPRPVVGFRKWEQPCLGAIRRLTHPLLKDTPSFDAQVPRVPISIGRHCGTL